MGGYCRDEHHAKFQTGAKTSAIQSRRVCRHGRHDKFRDGSETRANLSRGNCRPENHDKFHESSKTPASQTARGKETMWRHIRGIPMSAVLLLSLAATVSGMNEQFLKGTVVVLQHEGRLNGRVGYLKLDGLVEGGLLSVRIQKIRPKVPG